MSDLLIDSLGRSLSVDSVNVEGSLVGLFLSHSSKVYDSCTVEFADEFHSSVDSKSNDLFGQMDALTLQVCD